ncbi:MULTISPECIES: HIT domain-containing protein [Bombella]|uniref:HIT domain-containing protein n=1 Tax=Bombella pollinis TaxID=2967337 RepID=A0ABT3WIR9_9PROT|nr:MULTISPECIES: HIT domain-containing protein [Bombella]MCT6856031.1 HIT domain-containing protein [Bombella apis]MCX5618871.1 HIT domain-containing protein [Bombella pollinis]MUG04107.1 HIT domain-containing protein [Bombella sp. ESL0378]MUG89604.1 HIT domain-containing protein [Bombella sp. ESL0385]
MPIPNPAYDNNNVFAKILRGEIPAERVCDSKHSFAFYDISPATPIHILVVPRGAYTDLHDFTSRASDEEILDFWKLVDKITAEQSLIPSGFRLISNSGPDSGQEVPHFHVHLLGGQKLGPILCPPKN